MLNRQSLCPLPFLLVWQDVSLFRIRFLSVLRPDPSSLYLYMLCLCLTDRTPHVLCVTYGCLATRPFCRRSGTAAIFAFKMSDVKILSAHSFSPYKAKASISLFSFLSPLLYSFKMTLAYLYAPVSAVCLHDVTICLGLFFLSCLFSVFKL